MKLAVITFLLVAVHQAGPASADTADVLPLLDNTLFEDSTGAVSNGSGPVMFAGNNSGMNTRRAVILFDVAAAIPAGATIDSVTLILHVSSAPNDIARQFSLHRLLAPWGEGASFATSGGGAPSAPGDATWIHSFYPGAPWTAPGGDFDAAASAVATVASSGPASWSSPAMAAEVQQWLDSPAANSGWLVRGEENTAASVRRFETRESGSTEQRPVLRVHYTTPATPVAPVSWGRLKAEFQTDTSED